MTMTCLVTSENTLAWLSTANKRPSSGTVQSVHTDICSGTVQRDVTPPSDGMTFVDQKTRDQCDRVIPTPDISSAGEAEAHHRELFDTLDLDSSGYITAAKLCHVMTSVGMSGIDCVVDEMITLYDNDGDGRLTFPEFLVLMKDLGPYSPSRTQKQQRHTLNESRCVDGFEEPYGFANGESEVGTCSLSNEGNDEGGRAIRIPDMPQAVQDVLRMFDFDSNSEVAISDLERAAKLLEAERNPPRIPEDNPFLHWSKGREKRGLGSLVYKANHIALIVSDIGRSAAFYSNVLGFQQIRRPNFDRHGAWFTMGNLELHLIKGTPIVPSGDDLIVGHISIETLEIEKVPEILRKMKVPFQQNVSVPKAADAGQGTNESNTSDQIVKQYFIRDPDGYYIEICNCDVLTAYCLGSSKGDLRGNRMPAGNDAQMVELLSKWADTGVAQRRKRAQLIRHARQTNSNIESFAQILGYSKTDGVDPEKLNNLLVRRTVYGDICQNETPESLTAILLRCGNDVPNASDLMKLRALAHGKRVLQPPPFYENGTTKIIPPPFERFTEL